MEVNEKVDPGDVNKAPKIIKAAKEEIGKVDVLVCGECHDAFHYIEDFREHKEKDKCSGISAVRDNFKQETKPQVWAFLIWKHAHLKKANGSENSPSSWSIYQQWSKLDPKEKEAWIVAAENIQSFSKICTAKVQEVKANQSVINKTKLEKSSVSLSKNNSGDELLEEGEICVPKLPNAQQGAHQAKITANKNKNVQNSSDTHDSENEPDCETDQKVKQNTNKKTSLKTKPSNSDSKETKVAPSIKRALRTGKNEIIEEAVVEKILGRRLNHKKNCTEYFIKWENFSESENTWEPKIHLIKCRALIEEFDRIIEKKKLALKSVESQLEEMESDHGRPQRTSKQKALNQVKVWCGDMSEGEEMSGKRGSFSDDDSSDSFEKKIKLEDDSDSSDDEKPSVTIRRVPKSQSSVNGVSKKSLDVSLPTSPRVVRVSQKQLPNLSSGVYIMSKTEGIIKLDSNSTSPGGSLLKVGSKIGQTHIKMVKKDENSGSVAKLISTKLQTTPEKKFSPILSKSRGLPARKLLPNISVKSTKVPESVEKPLDIKPSIMDDDSDGLEELEFPTDLPLPSPDSPPGEFTLCPLTGRVLGESSEDVKESEDSTNDNTSLDTLVKMAAAELPDVDEDPNQVPLKKDTEIKLEIPSVDEPLCDSAEPTTPPISFEPGKIEPEEPKLATPPPTLSITTNNIATTVTDLEASIKPSAIQKSTSFVLNLDEGLTSQPKTTGTSFLSTTLTNVQVLSNQVKSTPPKKLLSTPSTVRQKVTTFQQRHAIHRPVMPKPAPTATIIHKLSPNRHKTLTKSFHEPIVKRTPNVATYKPANIAKRIGNTSIYKTEKPHPVSSIKKLSTPHFTSQPTIQTPPPSKPPAVINMPLLTTDEEPAAENSSSTELPEIQTLPNLTPDSEMSDLSTFNLTDSETPLLITGDDGTIYQVAGQNEEGQTILISEGPDGQQQCVIVSSDCNEDAPVVMGESSTEPEQMEVDQPLSINTQAEPEGDSTESEESQVVAQIIKADPPSPGGTRKVVLMLPDGNLMMTDVTAEQYAALELDK